MSGGRNFSLFLKGSLLLLLGIEIIQLLGCSYLRPPVSHIPKELPRSEDLLRIVKKRDEAIRSMRGLMSLLVRSGGKKYHLEEAFQIKEPAKIRIETLGLFGQPVFFLTSDGVTLSLFLPEKKRLYIGASSVSNISGVLPISLELYEIVDILAGKIPLIDSSSASARYDKQDRLMVIDFAPRQDALPSQRLWIDIRNNSVVRGELLNNKGRQIWRVNFHRFQEIQGILTPTLIKIEISEGPTTASIELDELEMNPVLREDSFRFSAPEGTEILPLR